VTPILDRQESRTLNIAAFVPSTTALGPGKRTVVWLQGCTRSCPGCMVPEFQPLVAREEILPESLALLVCSIEGIEGVTVSGGEPFLQAAALRRFLDSVRREGLSVMAYTGDLLEDLAASPSDDTRGLIGLIDILVDGPYRQDLDGGEMWRGSSNQGIHFLTDRYATWEWVRDAKGRETEIMLGENGKYITAGIPAHRPARSGSRK